MVKCNVFGLHKNHSGKVVYTALDRNPSINIWAWGGGGAGGGQGGGRGGGGLVVRLKQCIYTEVGSSKPCQSRFRLPDVELLSLKIVHMHSGIFDKITRYAKLDPESKLDTVTL